MISGCAYSESRDIRAPNLQELFSAGAANTNIVVYPPTKGNIQYLGFAVGNPNLKPEIAHNFGIGGVFTPTFIPGLNFSLDYYTVQIKDAIGSVGAQTIVDRCYSGQPQYCSAITLGTAPDGTLTISKLLISPFNFAQNKARGLDLESSYTFDLSSVYAPLGGSLALRALATHYLENYTNNGIDEPTDTAGEDAGNGPPSWLYQLNATYTNDPWTVTLKGRGVSSGTLSNAYVVCSTACPATSVAHHTINSNHVNGAFYVSASLSYDFDVYGGLPGLFRRGGTSSTRRHRSCPMVPPAAPTACSKATRLISTRSDGNSASVFASIRTEARRTHKPGTSRFAARCAGRPSVRPRPIRVTIALQIG